MFNMEHSKAVKELKNSGQRVELVSKCFFVEVFRSTLINSANVARLFYTFIDLNKQTIEGYDFASIYWNYFF